MKKNWLLLFIIAIFTAIVLAACGTSDDSNGSAEDNKDATEEQGSSEEEASEDGETYVIGATQIVEHPSLDAAYEGFQQAIEDAGLDVEFVFQTANGEPSNAATIANNFVADDVDLIFANSTPSAQTALQATTDIPIIFTSVTDAVDAGLIESMDQAGDNITGVLDMHPDAVQLTVDFIDKNFEGATVGFVYNAGEANSVNQVNAVKEAIEGTSLSTTEATVGNSSEVNQSANSLVGDADVFYIVTDNMVVSALESVISVAEEQGMPLIVAEPDSVKRGGFVAYGFEYYDIGYRAGEMAASILKGEQAPADIAPEYPNEIDLYINKEAAEAQGVEWQDEWDEEAILVETTAAEE